MKTQDKYFEQHNEWMNAARRLDATHSLSPSFVIMDTVPHIKAAGFTPVRDTSNLCIFPSTSSPSSINERFFRSNLQTASVSSNVLNTSIATINSTTSSLAPLIKPNLSPFDGPDNVSKGEEATRLEEDALHAFLRSHQEAAYRSQRTAPLGKSYERGFDLPNKEFVYGLQSRPSVSAKSLIYPEEQKEAIQLRSVSMSHVSAAEEEAVTRPLRRHYNWTSSAIDPTKFSFGQSSKALDTSGGSVLKVLHFFHPEAETRVISAHVLAHALTHPQLACGKPLRDEKLIELSKDTTFRFGKQSGSDGLSAREMITGNYTQNEQMPDKGLGKSRSSIRRAHTANPPCCDSSRVFGVPSVKQTGKRCTSTAEEEATGKIVLSPSPFASQGVHDEDFLAVRSPEYIRAIFLRMGVEFKDHHFQRLCESARSLYSGLSLDSFRHAHNRARLENRCTVCGAAQCQHDECINRSCRHDGESGMGNHRSFLSHSSVVAPLNVPQPFINKADRSESEMGIN